MDITQNDTDILEGIYQDLYEFGGYANPSIWPGKRSLLLVYGYDVPVDRFLSGLLKQDYEVPREVGSRFQALSDGGRPFTQSGFRSSRMSESATLISGKKDKLTTLARTIGKTIQYIPYNRKTQIEADMLGFMGIPYFDFPLVYRNNHSTFLREKFMEVNGDSTYDLKVTEVETYLLKKELLAKIGEASWDRRAFEKHMAEDGVVGRWRLLPCHFL